MKNRISLIFLTVLLLLSGFGCTTGPKEFSIAELDNITFEIGKVSMLVAQEADPDKKGESFLIEQLPPILTELKDHALEKHGIELVMDNYHNEIADGTINIEYELIDFGEGFNSYKWNNSNKSPQNFTIIIPLAITNNNTINCDVILYKDDPASPDNPFSKKLNFALSVKSEE